MAARFQIPMAKAMPKNFPPNTLPAQRALTAIQKQHPDRLSAAFGALYKTFWAEGNPIGEPDVVAKALKTVFSGHEVSEIMASTSTPEGKQNLTKNTEFALEKGAFGLPWFVATDSQGKEEGYWGIDHIGMLLEHMGLDRSSVQGLKALL